MGWLNRLRRDRTGPPPPEAPDRTEREDTVRSAPGVTALLDGLSPDGSHAVLDVGPAAESHLSLFGRFARHVRFGDLLPDPPTGEGWRDALDQLAPRPNAPYDVVLLWDLLDRIAPEARAPLIARLAELTAPRARVYLVVDQSEARTTRPVRFTLLDAGRVAQREVGPARPAGFRLLPAHVERVLEPFEVVRAFTLRLGLREYVAAKGGEEAFRSGVRRS